MQITLTNTGKRYNREWIFRHVDYEFQHGKTYAIVGPNGSGKSTMLQVIAGAILQTEGSVAYFEGQKENINIKDAVAETVIHKKISFAAPYLELIEEMTATEFLQFHAVFKNLTGPIPQVLQKVGLEKTAHKQIRYFSSGMKQRLKLAQAFFSDTAVLLLDEPTSNLDEDGIKLYHQLILNCINERLIIVSSNDKQEYHFCEKIISVSNYK